MIQSSQQMHMIGAIKNHENGVLIAGEQQANSTSDRLNVNKLHCIMQYSKQIDWMQTCSGDGNNDIQ